MKSQERQQFWQQHVDAWQASDLSGAAFCKQHELNYAQCKRLVYKGADLRALTHRAVFVWGCVARKTAQDYQAPQDRGWLLPSSG